ncbi:hypothetical protein [Streptomyces zaomyceticus]|uniref:hypothetical protein n=1 Tax=Streptomyces zaomyceticus TaxID=68286 RepID=UPI0032530528
MTAHSELRLLPWLGSDGKPCYLSTDDNNSYLSRLADSTEAIQLGLANDLVSHALEVLNAGEMEAEDLRSLSADLVGALQDTLRLAASRGHRPLVQESSRHDGSHPRRPETAAGSR